MNPRLIALSAVSFLVGLQFRNLAELFGSGSGSAGVDPSAAWAPDDFGVVPPRGKTTTTTTKQKQQQQQKRQKGETGSEEEEEARGRETWSAQRKRRKQRNGASEREGGEKEEEEKKKKKKKKKVKPQPRYTGLNYTHDFKPLPWTLPKPSTAMATRQLSSEEFMADYVAAKHKKKIALPWEQGKKYRDKPVTLPLPIIALNFPKSATLTMKTYFDCGGITAIHTSTQDGRIAICMMENHLADRPPLHGCDTHRVRNDGHSRHDRGVITGVDFVSDIGLQGPPCYYASLHDGGLEQIAKHYPEATILLVTRDADTWHRSMSKWGSILHRWKKYCGFDGSVGEENENSEYWYDRYRSKRERRGGTGEYWAEFYDAHTQKIREFAMKHMSLTYVEAELGDDLGEVLEKYTGVSPSCVMDCHPGPKWVKLHNATSRCHPVGENPALFRQEEEEEGSGSGSANDDGDDDGEGSGGDDDDDETDGNEEEDEEDEE